MAETVSVPLRGCGFEMRTTLLTSADCCWFPSPCGDVVLKCFLRSVISVMLLPFPSPCGDVVLKSLRLEALCRVAQNSILRRGSDSPPLCCGNLF